MLSFVPFSKFRAWMTDANSVVHLNHTMGMCVNWSIINPFGTYCQAMRRSKCQISKYRWQIFHSPPHAALIYILVFCTSHQALICSTKQLTLSLSSSYSKPVRVVGRATHYGVNGPGIKSRLGARFCTPIQICPGTHPASNTKGTGCLSRRHSSQGTELTTNPNLVPKLTKE